MQYSPMQFLTGRSMLFTFLLLLTTNLSYSRESDAIITSKADFILEVAYNIYYEKSTKSNEYEIGIYGRDSEAKALFTKLNSMVENLTIDDKSINIKLFKSMRAVLPVDIIYVSGDAKIRLGDLHEKLSDNDYSMITENYPFGSSAINFSLDNEEQIMFEIQETALRNNGATLRRQILKNRQRITSSKMWNAKLNGKVVNNSSNQLDGLKDTILVLEEEDTINETVEGPLLAEREWRELDACKAETQKAISAGKRNFNWLLALSLTSILGLGFYIYKLRKKAL